MFTSSVGSSTTTIRSVAYPLIGSQVCGNHSPPRGSEHFCFPFKHACRRVRHRRLKRDWSNLLSSLINYKFRFQHPKKITRLKRAPIIYLPPSYRLSLAHRNHLGRYYLLPAARISLLLSASLREGTTQYPHDNRPPPPRQPISFGTSVCALRKSHS